MATYIQVMERAITGFNNVWDALKNKPGLLDAGQKAGTTLVDVSGYGTLTNKLVSLVKEDGTLVDGSSYHSISFIESAKDIETVKSAPIVKGDTAYSIAFNPKTAGYYGLNNTLNTSIPFTDVVLSANKVDDGTSGIISIKNDSEKVTGYLIGFVDKLLGGVTVNVGGVEVSFPETDAFTSTAAVTLGAASSTSPQGISFEQLESSESTLNNSYYIDVTYSATAAGSITAKVNKNVTEGYVTAESGTVEGTFTLDSTKAELSKSETVRLAIPKGSVKVSSADNSNATASVSCATTDVLLPTDSTEEGIELKASVSGITLKGEFSKGYVTEGQALDVGDIVVGEGTAKLKKGSVPDQTLSLVDKTDIVTTPSNEALLDSSSELTINVNINKVTPQTMSDTKTGFVNSFGKMSATGSTTIGIAKAGNVGATAEITNYTLSGDSLSSTSSGNGLYTITVTPTLNLAKVGGFKAGFLLSDSEHTVSDITSDANKSYSINIAKGSVSFGTMGFAMDGTIYDKDGIADTIALDNIFLSSAPADRDYFKLKVSQDITVKEGYIKSDEKPQASVLEKFVPKAILEWVKEEGGTEEYLQVKSAGYLPSGQITEISTVEISEAVVTLNATSSDITLLPSITKGEESKYTSFTIVKSSVDAGYISDNKGSLAGTTYYIERGSVTSNPTATVTGTATPERKEETKDSVTTVSYDFALEAAITPNVEVKAGYVDSASINLTTPETQTGILKLSKASFARGSHDTTVVNTASNIETVESSSYSITAAITKCSASFSVSGAGYISAADNDDLTFAFDNGHNITGNGSVPTVYIKPGVAENNTFASASNTLTLTNLSSGKITESTTGDYTLTLGGVVNLSATIAEGYYGSSEAAISGTLTKADLQTFTVKHGKTAVAINGTNVISSTDATTRVALYSKTEKDADTDGKYAKISAVGTVSSTTTVTEGYVKQADATEEVNKTVTTDAYLELFETAATVTVEEDVTNWSVTVGQADANLPTTAPTVNESKVIETAAKYSTKDTTITLSDNAMGKAVVAQLLALEARLSGNLS